MNISEAIQILEMGIPANKNIMLRGMPGLGKTEIVKQVSQKLGYGMEIFHPVTWDATDAKGLPFYENGKAVWIPFGDLEKMITAKKETVILFDDVGQAPNSVQGALMQITLERRIGNHHVSPHCRFIICTNSKKDRAGASNILTALVNRFRVIEIEPDADSWIKWALKNDVEPKLIAFLKWKPEMISTFDPAKNKDAPFASPRSITSLSDWIKLGDTNPRNWEGDVGHDFAVEFHAFYTLYSRIAGIPEKVVNDPNNAPIPNELSLQHALCGALVKKADYANFANIVRYMKRISEEMLVSFVIQATTKNEDLKQTQTYVDFLAEYEEILQFA